MPKGWEESCRRVLTTVDRASARQRKPSEDVGKDTRNSRSSNEHPLELLVPVWPPPRHHHLQRSGNDAEERDPAKAGNKRAGVLAAQKILVRRQDGRCGGRALPLEEGGERHRGGGREAQRRSLLNCAEKAETLMLCLCLCSRCRCLGRESLNRQRREEEFVRSFEVLCSRTTNRARYALR